MGGGACRHHSARPTAIVSPCHRGAGVGTEARHLIRQLTLRNDLGATLASCLLGSELDNGAQEVRL